MKPKKKREREIFWIISKIYFPFWKIWLFLGMQISLSPWRNHLWLRHSLHFPYIELFFTESWAAELFGWSSSLSFLKSDMILGVSLVWACGPLPQACSPSPTSPGLNRVITFPRFDPSKSWCWISCNVQCLFIDLFSAVLGLCCCTRVAFSSVSELGLLSVAVQGLLIASLVAVAEHRL